MPQVSTVIDNDISGQTNLNTGDALDYTADHVVLFDSWANQSAGTFYYDAEHTYGQVANQTEGNIDASTLEGYSINDFEDLRYDNIATAPATHSTSPVAADSDGHVIAFFAPNGTVENDYDTGSGWQGPAPTGGTAAAGSGLAMTPDGNTIAFVDSSGTVVNDYHAASGWAGPGLTGGTSR